MMWWVIGLPVIGWLVQCLAGKRVIDALGPAQGRRVMGALAVLPIAIGFVIAVMATQAMAARPEDQRFVVLSLFDWIKLHSIHIPFEIRVDPLSLTMVLVVTGIGALIHLYATGYMADEPDYPRFFAYLNLFVAMMLLLVLGNNLAMLFIGWEGVGLCSYLLIGFWYKDLANSRAANKAFIVNRIGDVGLVLGMFLIMVVAMQNRDLLGNDPRWLSYDVLLPNMAKMFEGAPMMATAAGILLFIGAMGKSAQFPLYIWLPDAMAGPTPVSALIHAATMVTSGVVLINRMSPLYDVAGFANTVVVVVGLITAIFAALIAFGQTDIKKVLAYSTVSQLGFMFVACGVGLYWVGLFHVVTHAFFKALLFLGSGAVIHAMAHDQDLRNYGQLRKYIPITFGTMMAGYLALAGFPWTSGWFSKEEIIHVAIGSNNAMIGGVNVGFYAGWVLFGGALLTAVYMTRMMWLTFFGPEQRWRAIEPDHAHHDDHHEAEHAHAHAHADHGPDENDFFYTDEELLAQHEAHDDHHHHALDKNHQPKEVPISMWLPLVVLAVFSIGAGLWLGKELKYMPGIGNDRLENWLASGYSFMHHGGHGHAEHHAIPYEKVVQYLGYSIGILGIVIGVLWYAKGLPKSEGWDMSKWNPFRRSAGEQFGFDRAMVDAGVEGGGSIGNFLWKFVDAKAIDGFFNGVGKSFSGMGQVLRQLETGYARTYVLTMLVASFALMSYLVYVLNVGGGAR